MPYMAVSTAILILIVMTAQSEEQDPPLGKVFPAISWTTDYRLNGVSSSDRGPATQVSLHWWGPDNFYAGIWISQVDFDDPNSTSLELDTYAGRRLPVDRTEYQLELMYSAFDEEVPGPTYDFLQLKTAVTQNFDDGSLSASVRWSPQGAYGAGDTVHADVKATLELNDWLLLNGRIGVSRIERRPDRRFWSVGLTARWRPIYLDLRYVDTSLSFVECGFVDWCDSAVVGTVTLASY